MMRIYLAATFDSRPRMEDVANRLKSEGFEITARWVYGGEEGLTREQIALLDLEDVDAADAVVSFTYPRGTLTSGGGRHVEFGYGLAKGKKLILIGARENVFHEYPGVELHPTLEAWLASRAG
jgi:nucleoside 2-deoxyribosyltransferase